MKKLSLEKREQKRKTDIKFENRIRIYMKYMNHHEISTKTKDLKFSDIEEDGIGIDDVLVVSWLQREIKKDSSRFLRECFKYKDAYPQAYQKIEQLLIKMNKLSFEDRTKIFMEYIEAEKVISASSSLRFCDLDDSVQDQTKVGIWLQGILASPKKTTKLQEECSNYKDIYPNAYQKIINRLTNLSLSFEDKVRYFMKYINSHNFSSINTTTTFRDLDNQVNDNANVYFWFQKQLTGNYNNLLVECSKYKTIYPEAYSKLEIRIQRFNNTKKENFLPLEKRVFLCLKYLNEEEHELFLKQDKTSFSNIDHNVNDATLVYGWYIDQLRTNLANFIKECEKYKISYPIGYQKMNLRIKKFQSRLSFSEKMELFMKYVDTHPMIKQGDKLRFCDLDDKVYDFALVEVWVSHNLSNFLPKFIEEYSKYKDTYPQAYLKVSHSINKSKARLRKERICLIEELKVIRDSFLEEEKRKCLIKK